jgi:rhodanese-related sulfurtransferase
MLDVRTPAEYAEGHAAGAVSIPLDRLDAGRLGRRLGVRAGGEEPLYLICASGRRAEQAARKLRCEGLTNLALVDGGTQAWAAHRLPMRGISRLPSLERQGQIALGILILLILAKGTLLHPLFYVLIGLLGVGLIVSGITARCGLSTLLARLPWNRPQVRQSSYST